ncbi:MAG TPA: hypothetical protein VM553_16125, partial [Dongiaceae bacterium]|nr:hypothetical protein [Dongiaceae bacterium]
SGVTSSVLAKAINESVSESDFVFEGVVTNVQGRYSEPATPGETKIPYTFVTYKVDKVLKGNYDQAEVTLRFMGGVGEDGNVMMVAGQPLFDAGDHDLMMVKGNNTYPCPLVDCSQGRYRYIDGMVVNEFGGRVYLDAQGNMLSGEVIENEEIVSNELTDGTPIERREVTEIDPTEITDVSKTYPDATPADPSMFTEVVEQKIQQTYTAEQLANIPVFTSANPNVKFSDPLNSASNAAQAPPPAIAKQAQDDQMPEDERLEREQMERWQEEKSKQYNSTVFLESQKALNAKMEQEHPGFFAGSEDAQVVVAQVEENSSAGSDNTMRWGGVAGFLVLLGAVGGWLRKRRK